MTITLTGGQASTGQATNSTLTDSYRVLGAENLILAPGGGSLTVTGLQTDTNTTVVLGGISNPTPTQYQDTIQILLDGSGNTIESLHLPAQSYGGQLNGAVIAATVTGSGGSNFVDLTNNGGGTTALKIGGINNKVVLNGDATNSVTLGDGLALVAIGLAGDGDVEFTSTVSLSGAGNQLFCGDENFIISGGVKSNLVNLGNGANTVSLKGGLNVVSVLDGDNTIKVARGKNSVTVGSGVNEISAVGSNERIQINSGNKLLTSPGTDSVLLGGTGSTVNETNLGFSASANVSVFGSTSKASVSLSNGNDVVIAGGCYNQITLGSGLDTVSANGNWNSIAVGAGSDTVTDMGSFSTITLNGGNGSQDSTAVGNNDHMTGIRGTQLVSAHNNDTISLSDTNVGSAITFAGIGTLAVLSNDASTETDYNASGSGNVLQIEGDAMGDYTGHAVIDGLIPGNGSLVFSGIAGLTSSGADLLDFLLHPVPGGYEITTPGGGTVLLHDTQGLTFSMF